ncbi:xanthine dehydrogenase accessory protein XdhC [Vibrio ulleungensis]|uniref:Xanthine dehydrogenase accessory protein XdhC n=1 Tax=Vibrio ulleungensis TaxID=2807619 RepID=A0ABS2HIP1_9VIBR|nr:xanthine dehydrogenase accessory protein XdhC [Vibrio ulleungensis]MBM7036038.1 xanthine dehydrogenase accessory protein XdhC [Vibrio ulleungensis]
MNTLKPQPLHSPSLSWLEACQWLELEAQAYCIATVIAHMGSVPRDSGSKIVITESSQYDTLGGGNLEHQIINHAREQLTHRLSEPNANQTEIIRFALTADLAQCCGGAVQVLLEYFNTAPQRVALFGAGHVGQALCTILAKLPCAVTVYDHRDDWLSTCSALGVATQSFNCAESAIRGLPNNTLVVIMTHDHALDYELAEQALQNPRLPFVGLIGSASKNQRFRYRLNQSLDNSQLLEKLTCPIGHPDIKGKLPMQVAVSVAAQLMQQFEKNRPLTHEPTSTAKLNTAEQVSSKQVTSKKANELQWQQANLARKQIAAMPLEGSNHG